MAAAGVMWEKEEIWGRDNQGHRQGFIKTLRNTEGRPDFSKLLHLWNLHIYGLVQCVW